MVIKRSIQLGISGILKQVFSAAKFLELFLHENLDIIDLIS